jgi:hypothetical protein
MYSSSKLHTGQVPSHLRPPTPSRKLQEVSDFGVYVPHQRIRLCGQSSAMLILSSLGCCQDSVLPEENTQPQLSTVLPVSLSTHFDLEEFQTLNCGSNLWQDHVLGFSAVDMLHA